jgi:GTP-binding nuclear protein Ran
VVSNIDVDERRMPSKSVTFHKKNSMSHFEISAESNYNSGMLLLAITRQLTRDLQLAFTTVPVQFRLYVILEPILQGQYELEVEAAAAIPLPDDDNDFPA